MDEKIRAFKGELQRLYNVFEQFGVEEPVLRAIEHLHNRFDRLFSVNNNKPRAPQNINELIEKYCHKDRNLCPICGAVMTHRRGKYGTFFGCSRYPSCRGTRRVNGAINISYALIEFLNEAKEAEKAQGEENRFNTLEI